MKKLIITIAIIALSAVSYIGAMWDYNPGGTWECEEYPTITSMAGEVVRWNTIYGGYQVYCQGISGTCWSISGGMLFINSDFPPGTGTFQYTIKKIPEN